MKFGQGAKKKSYFCSQLLPLRIFLNKHLDNTAEMRLQTK